MANHIIREFCEHSRRTASINELSLIAVLSQNHSFAEINFHAALTICV